jgi:hypothetical protein
MEKDPSIVELLERLSAELTEGFEIVDYWDADLCAIGIQISSSPSCLIYISTFNQLPDQYYYECEVAESKESLERGSYQVAGKGQVENFKALVQLLKNHLYSLN